jgi:hypothetical protein
VPVRGEMIIDPEAAPAIAQQRQVGRPIDDLIIHHEFFELDQAFAVLGFECQR